MTRFIPAKGDRVSHEHYGAGTITELDVFHTVIEFDAHGSKRFVTGRAVLERSSTPAPPPRERRAAAPRRVKAERAPREA
jgi:hypothetical protein